MNANLPTAPKPQIVAGAQVAALVPQTLDEAFRVSQAIAASGMAPKGIEKPEQIMVAIMAGAELGLAPFQSLQSFAVVNGRPTLWGDGLLAVVRGRGVRVNEWLEGEGDNMVAWCEATRPDSGEVITRSFTVADAKKATLWAKAGPWQQYPKRMLQMRARALALRDGCADMLRGIQVREEVEDYQPIRDVTPQRSGLRERLAAHGAGTAAPGFSEGGVGQALGDEATIDQTPHDPQTGEIIDAQIDEASPDPDDAGAAAEDEDDFPGDKPSTTTRAASSANNGGADGGAPSGFKTGAKLLEEQTEDLVQWATDLTAELDGMDRAGIDEALADPKNIDRFERLSAAKPGMAEALNIAIDRRKQELARG